jgi:hypothetical protein
MRSERMRRHLASAMAISAALLIAAAPPTGADPAGLPQEIVDAIHSDAADRILFEDEHGIILIDKKFKPMSIYDPVEPQYRSLLQENVYRDLMKFMADGQREMVGLLLIIKSGGFLWPADMRFQAIVTKKDRVVATVPMSFAVYGLVGRDYELDWIGLGDGESRTLVPREDRLVPPQLQGMPQIYRVYILFPAQIEIDGEYRGWDPFKVKEVRIEPVR